MPELIGLLAMFDLRAIDPICKSSVAYPVPDAFTTARGECCIYTFTLTVFDRTSRPCGTHHAQAQWPVKICNDLRPT